MKRLRVLEPKPTFADWALSWVLFGIFLLVSLYLLIALGDVA